MTGSLIPAIVQTSQQGVRNERNRSYRWWYPRSVRCGGSDESARDAALGLAHAYDLRTAGDYLVPSLGSAVPLWSPVQEPHHCEQELSKQDSKE